MEKSIIERLLPPTPEEKKALENMGRVDRDIYMDQYSSVVKPDKLLESGSVLALRPHVRFVSFPLHSHDYIEAVYCIEGSMVHSVNGERVILSQGEILLLGERACHEIEKCGERDIAMNILILPSFFSSLVSSFSSSSSVLKSFILGTLVGKEQSGYLHFHVKEDIAIQNTMENIIHFYTEGERGGSEISRRSIELLFLLLLQATERADTGGNERSIVLKTLSYIRDNYRQGTLQDLASKLGLDISSLSRTIRRETGKTWTELMQEKRLENACCMLESTRENVDNISRSVGYENISYFHRIFRKKFNMGPKEYRDARKDTF